MRKNSKLLKMNKENIVNDLILNTDIRTAHEVNCQNKLTLSLLFQ